MTEETPQGESMQSANYIAGEAGWKIGGDGSTEANAGGVSEAVAAAASAPQAPSAEEVIDAQPQPQMPAAPALGGDQWLLGRARGLPLLPEGAEAQPARAGLQSFKDADGTTMLVVVSEGALFKQPFTREEN